MPLPYDGTPADKARQLLAHLHVLDAEELLVAAGGGSLGLLNSAGGSVETGACQLTEPVIEAKGLFDAFRRTWVFDPKAPLRRLPATAFDRISTALRAMRDDLLALPARLRGIVATPAALDTAIEYAGTMSPIRSPAPCAPLPFWIGKDRTRGDLLDITQYFDVSGSGPAAHRRHAEHAAHLPPAGTPLVAHLDAHTALPARPALFGDLWPLSSRHVRGLLDWMRRILGQVVSFADPDLLVAQSSAVARLLLNGLVGAGEDDEILVHAAELTDRPLPTGPAYVRLVRRVLREDWERIAIENL